MSASILVPGECLLISLTWFGKSCHSHESEALEGLDIVMNIHLYRGTLPSSKYFLEWYIVTPFIPTRFFLFLLFMKSLRNNILIWCQLIWVVHHYFFFLSFFFLFILFSNNISQPQFPLPSLFPGFPPPPDPLFLSYPSKKRSDDNWTQHNNMQ